MNVRLPMMKWYPNLGVESAQEIILYGAGHNARRVLFDLQQCPDFKSSIVCIVDKSIPENVNSVDFSSLLGIPVVSVGELSKYSREIPIVVTPDRYSVEITNTLSMLGFENIYYFSIENAHAHAAIALQTATNPMLYDKSKISTVVDMLADHKSKMVFNAKLESWFNCNHSPLEQLKEDYTYFPGDIMHLNKKEVLVDCGMCIGGTILDFVEKAKKYDYIYGFEPAPISYELSCSTLKSLKNCTLYNSAVGDKYTTSELLISQINPGANRLSDCVMVNPNDFPDNTVTEGIEVEVVKLDDTITRHKPTIIKMDIEGAELSALKGATELIKSYQPKLAISAYHHPAHMYEIPLLIKELYPNYKIYFRQHSVYFETVCYAVIN